MRKRLPLAQRQVMLAAVAFLAAVAAIAVTSKHASHSAALPAPSGSYSSVFAAGGPASLGKKTSCGVVLDERAQGVESSMLPCGVRIYLVAGSTTILASVIGSVPGHAQSGLGLSPALAQRLGVSGVKRLQWSYAGGG